jgi:hypothetical protein
MKRSLSIRCGVLVLLGAALAAPAPAVADPPPANPRVEFAAGLVENERRLARSPDGKWTISVDGTVMARLVDVKTGKLAGPPLKHSDGFRAVRWAFSPDGKLVATGAGRRRQSGGAKPDNEGEVRVWEVATGKLVAELDERVGSVRALAFTADGKYVRYEADPFEQSGK